MDILDISPGRDHQTMSSTNASESYVDLAFETYLLEMTMGLYEACFHGSYGKKLGPLSGPVNVT